MGKPLLTVPSTKQLHHQLRRLAATTTHLISDHRNPHHKKPNSHKPKSHKPISQKLLNMNNSIGSSGGGGGGGGGGGIVGERKPLSVVVCDCVRRWFRDTLKEAKTGDVNMQVLVGQMYASGYGVDKDEHKGKLWMTRASRVRSSVWKVSEKPPGYNASDSDSDELKGDL
ncbi:hypothetical protein AKJ16_DCAP05024 [Drosera capensis]